jgi:hypothetical protein
MYPFIGCLNLVSFIHSGSRAAHELLLRNKFVGLEIGMSSKQKPELPLKIFSIRS